MKLKELLKQQAKRDKAEKQLNSSPYSPRTSKNEGDPVTEKKEIDNKTLDD